MGKKKRKRSRNPEAPARQDFETGPADFDVMRKYLTGDQTRKLSSGANDISTKPRKDSGPDIGVEDDLFDPKDTDGKERRDQ